MGVRMRTPINNFKKFNEIKESTYMADYDNILNILKVKYGYGDIPHNYFIEFEEKNSINNINSDEEYSKKLDEFIDPHGLSDQA